MIARARLLPLVLALIGTAALAQDEAPVAPLDRAPDDSPLLEAVPSGAFAFAESAGLAELIAAVRDSDLLQTILASEQFAEFQQSEQGEKMQDGIKLAEFILRMNLWEAGEKLLGGRAALALYPKDGSEKPDAVFLLRPADPRAWAGQRLWTDPLLGLSAKRLDRQRFNWGLKAYQTKGQDGQPAFVALNRHWIAVASTQDLLERTISLQVDDPAERERRELEDTESLAGDETFAMMAERTGDDRIARVFFDTATIRKATGGRLGLPEKMDNPLASFVAGGILELAAHSTIATVTADTSENSLVLEAGFDGDPRQLDERFHVFFSDHPRTGTTALPEVPGLIGGFTLYRDIATWYRSRDELLVESVLPEFDKFEAGVGNLLPGKDIGEDVLPLLGDNITFVSALQSYDHLSGKPGVQFPGFAFIIELEEAQQAGDIFQLFFQTLLSVLNLEAGKQDRQPWLIDARMHNDVRITTARYLQNPEGDRLPVVFNFLPASARLGDKFIVSSSLELCENLIDALRKPGADDRLDRDLHFQVRFQPLGEILGANADHFKAQRIGEGRTPEQANADVELFLAVLRHLESFAASTSTDEDGFKLRLEANLHSAD